MQLPDTISTALGWLAYEFAQVQPFIPTYTHLIVSALFPIYAGAHSSLSRPSTAAKPVKARRKDGSDVDDEDETPMKMEGLSPTDALMFPILAGTTLAGLYFLLKWLQDPTILNKILNWYFATFSVFSVSRLVSDGLDVFHSILFPHDHLDRGVLFHVDPQTRLAISVDTAVKKTRASPLPWVFSRLPLPQILLDFFWMLHILPNRKLTFKAFVRNMGSFKLGLGIHGLEGLTVGLASVLYYNFVSKPWWLTNLMGFGFAYGSMQIMSPTTFWTGTLILSGLFFYDIYFVFYTPMMVTVAKSLDIPIKLLFPRPPEPGADPAIRPLSMLGLGDVVLPGIMIGLALRFDLHMFYRRKQSKVAKVPAAPVDPSEALQEVMTSSTTSATTEKSTEDSKSDGEKQSHEAESVESNTTLVKAPYVSVAEAWGDRLWTSSMHASPAQTYTARGVFPKPYFRASMFGYVMGMLATLAAMQLYNHAQPALLYLVPGVLSSLWGTAYLRGEFHDFWNFSDAAEIGENDPSTKQSDKENNTEQKDDESSKSKSQGISSFFGFRRAEERSQRLEKSMAKHVDEPKATEHTSGSEESESKSGSKDDGGASGSTFFSFSIVGPPPLFPKSQTNEKKRSERSVSPPSEDEQGEGADDAVPRWSSGISSDTSEEHVGKRQRLG